MLSIFLKWIQLQISWELLLELYLFTDFKKLSYFVNINNAAVF